jgi:hypothetical protein
MQERAYMGNCTASRGKPVLHSLLVHRTPHSPSASIRQPVFNVNTDAREVTRKIDNESVIYGRSAGSAVPAPSNGNGESLIVCVLEGLGNIVRISYKSDDGGTTAGVGGPPGEGLLVVRMLWGNYVALERGLE